jgi:Na+/H+ antiporter NhaD/arsenite permease-like protein
MMNIMPAAMIDALAIAETATSGTIREALIYANVIGSLNNSNLVYNVARTVLNLNTILKKEYANNDKKDDLLFMHR